MHACKMYIVYTVLAAGGEKSNYSPGSIVGPQP